MTDVPVRPIGDIHDLMLLVDLSEIRTFEVHGQVTGAPADQADEAEINIEYSEYLDDNQVHTRFKMTVTATDAFYRSDMASVFSFQEPLTVARPVLNDFAERVGFMAVFPYLRESVSTTATRLGRRVPLIGLMRPGDVKISGQPEPSQNSDKSQI